jgi:hypothetical protein
MRMLSYIIVIHWERRDYGSELIDPERAARGRGCFCFHNFLATSESLVIDSTTDRRQYLETKLTGIWK